MCNIGARQRTDEGEPGQAEMRCNTFIDPVLLRDARIVRAAAIAPSSGLPPWKSQRIENEAYSILIYFILVVAGLAAGALNAVAGGGTFLSFPALVWAGVPPVMANATATLSSLPGYLGSAWEFRNDIRSDGPLHLKTIVLIAIAGSFLGALLLLTTSSAIFSAIVPWLLLLATIVFAAGPLLLEQVTGDAASSLGNVSSTVLLLCVAIYGGYFNGGLGIMLLAVFGLIGFTDLNAANGLKNAISAILSLVSVATYTIAGLIDWTYVLPLSIATAVGGYLGAGLARRVTNTTILRGFITIVGGAMTIAFFIL